MNNTEKVNKTARELATLYGQFLSEIRKIEEFESKENISKSINDFISLCSWEYDNKDKLVDISELRGIIMSKLKM